MIQEKEQIDFSTGEVKKVNTNFFQVYKDNVDILIDIGQGNRTALALFLWICKHMDDRNALVVSQEALADSLGVTTRTIQYAVAHLREKKALEIIKSGSSNIYALNSKIVWQNDVDSKKYAHFTAKVFVTEKEQNPECKTQLFGHAIPKKRSNKPKQNETITKFEKEKISSILPSNIKEFIKKGYVYVGETDNAYELNDEKGMLTIIPK